MARLLCKVIFSGCIELLTGMHIGGNSESFEIGGMDSPVIRDPITNFPFIPGSSLKGKMRSELEWCLGVAGDNTASNDHRIVALFGIGADTQIKNEAGKVVDKRPTRVLVRDAFPEGYDKIDFHQPIRKQLNEDTKGKFKNTTIALWNKLDMGLPFTEWKKENSINRVNSTAVPRDIERVPAGSKFKFEIVFLHFYGDDVEKNLDNLITSILLVEDSSLGGSGSRGYGKIIFSSVQINIRSINYYKNPTNGRETITGYNSFRDIKLNNITSIIEKCKDKQTAS